MGVSLLIPNAKPKVVEDAIQWETRSPRLGHYVHPQFEKTALCGRTILGIPAYGDFDVCPVCRYCHSHGIAAVVPERDLKRGGESSSEPPAD